jgi:hypothetical protein
MFVTPHFQTNTKFYCVGYICIYPIMSPLWLALNANEPLLVKALTSTAIMLNLKARI